jgi:hypothetical protein
VPTRWRRRRWCWRRFQAKGKIIGVPAVLLSWVDQLDWLNLFNGLTRGQIISVIITIVVFTAASGLCLVALNAFGVRAGLVAARATANIPTGRSLELLVLLAASAAGFLADELMIFFGLINGSVFAELYTSEPMVLVVGVGLTVLSGILLLAGAALGMRSLRRSRPGARLRPGTT